VATPEKVSLSVSARDCMTTGTTLVWSGSTNPGFGARISNKSVTKLHINGSLKKIL